MTQKYTFLLSVVIDAADVDLCHEMNADFRQFMRAAADTGATSSYMYVFADGNIIEKEEFAGEGEQA